MNIYVPQGAAPGGARLIRAQLDRLHAATQIMSVRTDGDRTANALEARAWAQEHGVPATTDGIPDTVLLTRNLTQTGMPDWTESEDLWQRLENEQPERMNAVRWLINLFKTRTKSIMWLNTGVETTVQ